VPPSSIEEASAAVQVSVSGGSKSVKRGKRKEQLAKEKEKRVKESALTWREGLILDIPGHILVVAHDGTEDDTLFWLAKFMGWKDQAKKNEEHAEMRVQWLQTVSKKGSEYSAYRYGSLDIVHKSSVHMSFPHMTGEMKIPDDVTTYLKTWVGKRDKNDKQQKNKKKRKRDEEEEEEDIEKQLEEDNNMMEFRRKLARERRQQTNDEYELMLKDCDL
jgi:hypothetical protein